MRALGSQLTYVNQSRITVQNAVEVRWQAAGALCLPPQLFSYKLWSSCSARGPFVGAVSDMRSPRTIARLLLPGAGHHHLICCS